MTIRPAQESDLAALLALYAAFFREDAITTPVTQIATNLKLMMADSRARIFVAVEQDQIIGFSSGTLTFSVEFGFSNELEDLYIIPAKRGAGWARRLATSVLDWAFEAGANETFLVITPEAEQEQSLTGFYRKLGFRISERITMIRTS